VIDSNDRTLTILHSTTVFISVVIITRVWFGSIIGST
jgi:hypothetical protein